MGINPLKYDLLVFDLDGTLADTAGDIAEAMRRVLARLGRPAVARERVLSAIGRGVRRLAEGVASPPHEPVVEEFMKEYSAHLLEATRLYPGVAETLEALASARKIVLSNKPAEMSRRVVEGLGIARRFEAVYGGDSFPECKPDPACLRRAAGGARRILMVGDSAIDVQAAQNAGVEMCAVTYGYAREGDLAAADFRIDRFGRLLDIVRQVVFTAGSPALPRNRRCSRRSR